MSFAKPYLFAYNAFAFLSWLCVGHFVVMHFVQHGLQDFELFTEKAHKPLAIAQTLAILEIVHALVELVKSDAMTTGVQVLSRLHVVWLILPLVPIIHDYLYLYTAVAAWAAVELIRYPFYALNVYNKCPIALTWLRYSAFIVLYPIGIFSEVRTIVHALPFFRDTAALRAWPESMPNWYNFQIDLYVAYIVVLCIYVPGSIHMYTHMLTQRKKALTKAAEKVE